MSDDIPPALDDIYRVLLDLERRVVPGSRLWLREWAATSARGSIRHVEAYKVPRFGLRSAAHLAAAERMIERFGAILGRLHDMDLAEFGGQTEAISSGRYTPADFVAALKDLPPYEHDVFARKLLAIDEVPDRETERTNEMVFYEASAVLPILELIEALEADDVLYDLGSGLGLVLLLAAWFKGVRVKGVEYDPAYCRLSEERARALGFDSVEVIHADAKDVDYSDGTVFYFFHPFEGRILEAVLAKLEALSKQRPIRVFARGACEKWFDKVPWLRRTAKLPSGLGAFAAG